MAAAKPRAAATRPATPKTRGRPAKPGPPPLVRLRGRLATMRRSGKLLLAGLGAAAFLALVFLVISLATADDASTSEESLTPDPFEARTSSREVLTTQRLAAHCALYAQLEDEHGQALELTPPASLEALASVEAAVPDGDSELVLAFAHLRRAIQLDLEAAAWTEAGSQQRALDAYQGAEAEALQADAYASAACEA